MVANQRLYPRATLRRIVKAHTGKKLSKNADILIFLDYVLFMQHLVREASIHAKKSGDRQLTARNVRRCAEGSLRKFKG